MLRLIFCFIAFFASFEVVLAGEVSSHSYPSDVLDRDYTYLTYLPDEYQANAHAEFPVVYLLHGSLADETFWSDYLDIKPIFDYLIGEGKIPPAIVIMPHSKSWWVDGYNEAAETAFIEEFIPHIENKWRAVPRRGARVIGGISAGGYGTVNFVLKYPEVFGAGAALSPASYEDLPPKNSSSYQHPTYLDAKGEFDQSLWRSLNYPSLIDSYKEQDLVVPIYINSGDHDGLDIAYHAAVLYQRFREHQPDKVELRIIDGDHELDVWVQTLPEAMEYAFESLALPTSNQEPDAP